MKKLTLSVAILITGLIATACPTCDLAQPRYLKGITHGAGPQSNWDYLIIWAMVAVVLFTLFFSVKWLIRPGEKSNGHIKRFILNNE